MDPLTKELAAVLKDLSDAVYQEVDERDGRDPIGILCDEPRSLGRRVADAISKAILAGVL